MGGGPDHREEVQDAGQAAPEQSGGWVLEVAGCPVPLAEHRALSHRAYFRVIDTGPATPENMQQKIFEPFVQADVGLSPKYGTGLRLSICQQLSKLMDGDIHLKIFEGAGSTFTLRIPMQYFSGSLSAAGSSLRYGRPRSVTRSRRSAHTTITTTRSISAFLGAAFSGRSIRETPTAPDGNMHLVGLSQPFFVPS
jgi:osomolarity two-component system sensor histidine kinase SLN1